MGFRSDIPTLILGSLQPEPLHGYSIVRRLRESGAVEKLSEGQIYPYLHRLEEERFVVAHWDTETGGAPRRVYSITPEGLTELNRQRQAWSKFSSGVGALLTASPKLAESGNA